MHELSSVRVLPRLLFNSSIHGVCHCTVWNRTYWNTYSLIQDLWQCFPFYFHVCHPAVTLTTWQHFAFIFHFWSSVSTPYVTFLNLPCSGKGYENRTSLIINLNTLHVQASSNTYLFSLLSLSLPLKLTSATLVCTHIGIMPSLIPLDNLLGAFFLGVVLSSMCKAAFNFVTRN